MAESAERQRSEAAKRRAAAHKRQSIIRTARIQRKIERWGIRAILPIVLQWVDKTINRVSYNTTILPGSFPDISKPILQMLRYAMAAGVWEMNRLLNQLVPGRVQTFADEFDFTGPLEKALDSFVSSKPEQEWHHVIPAAGLKWMEGYTYELKGILEKPVLDKVQSVIREGIGTLTTPGMTEDEVQDRLRAVLPDLVERRLQAIARTESMRCYNMGQLIELKKAEAVCQGVEFCAVLDSRTTEMCQERDGLILRQNDPRVWDNTPPLHPNCRSILIPIIITEEIEASRWEGDAEMFDTLAVDQPVMIRPADKEHIQLIMTKAAKVATLLPPKKKEKPPESTPTRQIPGLSERDSAIVQRDPDFYEGLTTWSNNLKMEREQETLFSPGGTPVKDEFEARMLWAQDWLAKQHQQGKMLDVSEEQVERILDDLRLYTGHGSHAMRDLQFIKDGKEPLDATFKRMKTDAPDDYQRWLQQESKRCQNVERFIQMAPRVEQADYQVFRGLRDVPDFLQQADVGKVVYSSAIMSATGNTSTAESFGENVTLVFANPKALRAAPISTFSHHSMEDEYLVSSANVFKVQAIKDTARGGKVFVLEVVEYRTPTAFQVMRPPTVQ